MKTELEKKISLVKKTDVQIIRAARMRGAYVWVIDWKAEAIFNERSK